MRKFGYTLLSLLGLSLISSSAWAQNANADLSIGASIPAKCRVTSLPDIDFGAYTAAASKDASANFYVQCNNRTFNLSPIKVQISCGNNGTLTNGVCTRSMTNQTDVSSPRLSYGIYTDTGRTTSWNNNTQSFVVDNNGAVTMSMFLRVPPSQHTAKKGSYYDQISVSLSF